MDFLTSIDSAGLRRLRHISARSHPLVLYPHPNDSSMCYPHGFPTVLQLFPGLQLSTLTVRDTYHEPGTWHDGSCDAPAYGMVEDLIKSDGFEELIYTSTSHCFMRPKDFEPFLEEYTPRQEKALYRDPQPSTWDQMIKKRDGLDSGGGVEMFRHTKDGRIRLKDEFETPAPLDVNLKFLATDPVSERISSHSVRLSSHLEDRWRQDNIEVRVKRGEGADYEQTGQCSTDYERWLHDFFKERTWEQTKEQGLNLEVRDEDPAVWL